MSQPVSSKADTGALIYELADLFRSIKALRAKLCLLANTDVSLEFLQNAADLEEAMRTAERVLGRCGIPLVTSDKPERKDGAI
jgi:hypothetical protein